MKPSPELIAAVQSGKLPPCDTAHGAGTPRAAFYCTCGAVFCASCAPRGFCPKCRAAMRSLGALALEAKENA